MIRSCFFATGLLAFSAPAQSAEYLLDLRASNDQVSRMFKGKEEVASLAGDTIAILLEPSATQDRLIRLTVALSNGGSTSVNFGPENVRLVYGEGRSVSMCRRSRDVPSRYLEKRRTR